MMKDYHINIFYSEADEAYIADIPDLKYCSAFGKTPEAALQEVQIAKEAWLETRKLKEVVQLELLENRKNVKNEKV